MKFGKINFDCYVDHSLDFIKCFILSIHTEWKVSPLQGIKCTHRHLHIHHYGQLILPNLNTGMFLGSAGKQENSKDAHADKGKTLTETSQRL